MISREQFSHLKNIDSVVLFSTADWDNPFWTNKQHMACHLAEAGFKVLYVESLGLRKVVVNGSDLGRIFRKIRKAFSPVKEVRKNVWVFAPLVIPAHDRPWVQKFNRLFLRTMISYFQFRLGFKNSLGWTYNPLTWDILKGFFPSGVVYHSVDDLTASPRLPKQEIERKEKELLQNADLVFVTSVTLAEKYRKMGISSVYYYSNVADYAHFAQARNSALAEPKELAALSGPKIGFIGAISSYKVDFPMLAAAAEKTPDWNWVMIGKVGEGDPMTDDSLLQKKNIHLLGPRSYQELPAYLKYFDVVIIPSPLNDYTRSMFPMKFFEYLAAGKVVVSTPLPSLRDHKEAFLCVENADQLVESLGRVLRKEVVYNQVMEKMAQEHTWEHRTEAMLRDIDGVLKKSANH